MSGVQELFLSRLPDEQPGECLTSHAVCIPQTLISDISGAVNDGRVSFFLFFYPPFVQDMLIIQTRLLLPSFPTPLTWWPPKTLEGQKGRQEVPHKLRKPGNVQKDFSKIQPRWFVLFITHIPKEAAAPGPGDKCQWVTVLSTLTGSGWQGNQSIAISISFTMTADTA